MKGSYNRIYGTADKLRFPKYFWIFPFFLFLTVMIIPSLIVFSSRTDLLNIHGFLDASRKSISLAETIGSQKSSKTPVPKTPLEMGWISGSGSVMQHLADYKNLKIVSPALATINDKFALEVVPNSSVPSAITSQGKKVWARILIQSDTKTNVHAFLSNPDKVQSVVNNLIESAKANHWDGINLDIENVSSNDRDAFTSFVKNLSEGLKKSSLVLSVDLPAEQTGSNAQAPFDHKQLGKYCNYIIFMGYDQHWSTDPVPGPVTSLSWLKENIQEFIQTGIPPGELILGLPAYTRIWEQNQQNNIVQDPAEPIQYVENVVAKNHPMSWDPELGEFFTSYSDQNLQYKIWLPTEKSFGIYLDLIPQYHLAGSAVWNLDQINPDYWNKIF